MFTIFRTCTYPVFLFIHIWTLSVADTEILTFAVVILALCCFLHIHKEFFICIIQNIIACVTWTLSLRISFEWQWHWNKFILIWWWIWLYHFQVHYFWFCAEELLVIVVGIELVDIHNWSWWNWNLWLHFTIQLQIWHPIQFLRPEFLDIFHWGFWLILLL